MSKNYRFVDKTRTHTFTLGLNPDFFELTTTLIPTFIPTTPTTMAPTEKEWAAMASKYGYGIDLDEATKDKLVEFIQTMIYIYKTQDLTDTDLWLIFQEQFKGFTVESFKKICTDLRSKLRRHVLKRGVYIGKHSNRVTISKRLFEVIQQEELH